MDTTKTEKLLKDFEREIKNVSEVASILKSIKTLHLELSTSSLAHKNNTADLIAVSLKLSTLTDELSSKIDVHESALTNGLLTINRDIKSGAEKQVSILKAQTKIIEDTVQSQLHLALTRYETFVRGELLSLKERVELNFKELNNQDATRTAELKNILDQTKARIMVRMAMFFGLSVLMFSGLALLLIMHS